MGDGVKHGKNTDEMLGHLAYWLAKRLPGLNNQQCERLLELEFPKRREHRRLTIQKFSAYRGDADHSPQQLGVNSDEGATTVLRRIDGKRDQLKRLLSKISQSAAEKFLGNGAGKRKRSVEHGVSKRPRELPANEAVNDGTGDDQRFAPSDGDNREVVNRQIRMRRGQQQFRDIVRKRYRSRCLVTGCKVLDVLEAAHIKPYRGDDDNHPENGLLLRADIHTLFDLDLLGIDPDQLRVRLHPRLMKDPLYQSLANKELHCAKGRAPSTEALALRFKQFQMRCHETR